MVKLIKAELFEQLKCETLKKTVEKSRLEKYDFTNTLIAKPWGYEYMNYEAPDKSCCSWYLHIYPFKGTSLHCHATKTTFIHVIHGSIILELAYDDEENKGVILLKEGESLLLEKKVFHAMTATSQGAELLEMESPSFKPDAIRLYDKLDREGKPYESKCAVVTW